MGFTGVTEYVFWFCGFHVKKENKNGRSTAFPLVPWVRANYWEAVILLLLEEKYLVIMGSVLRVLSHLGPDILHSLDDKSSSSFHQQEVSYYNQMG